MSFSELFFIPPKTHSPLAFWFWNGELEPTKLRWQIDEMVDKGVYGGFMHSRGYLKTPYLEQPWWDAVDACIDEAKKKGFFPWLYDEYAWPSGTAGSTFEYGFQKPSRVLALGEFNMAKGLSVHVVEDSENAENTDSVIGRYVVSGEGESLRFNHWAKGESLSNDCRILEFRRQIYPTAVDYLNKDTISTFIKFTHEEYKKRYKDNFGSLIPGIFFDEIYMIGAPLPWTDKLPEEFYNRTGKNLLDLLPFLVEEGGTYGRTVRQSYFTVVAQLYEEAFFSQISQWCEENGLSLTGHTEEHLGGHPRRQGNYFDTIRHLQIPGADNHDYRYRFPRKITYVEPKYSVSVARAYGKERAMSEAMGGAGWGCSLQQFKRGINTMAAMGISMFVLHGFYYECEHQGSQADWPTSFFYQNPYWKYFKQFADYISRVCLVNSTGRAVVEVGLFYPIDEMQADTVNGKLTQVGINIDRCYHNALNTLIEQQIDVDIIDKKSILSASLADGLLCAGKQRFKIILIPNTIGNDYELEDKLAKFISQGGKVIKYCCGGDVLQKSIATNDLPQAINAILPTDIQIVGENRFDLFTCHRVIDERDWYFVSNSSSIPRIVTIRLRVPDTGAIEKYSIETGKSMLISTSAFGENTEVQLELGADEACYLVTALKETLPISYKKIDELAVQGKWSFLPMDKIFDDSNSVCITETELEIPLATFTSELHHEPVEIRVKNTAWEAGNCGRHLSLWDARWITRRPSWHCCPSETDLYFRKIFNLESIPQAANLCIAAVNFFTLFINGKKVLEAESNAQIVEGDISQYLQKGENIIAVHVINDKPLPYADLNTVEELPKDRLISLLLQGDFQIDNYTHSVLQSDSTWIVSNKMYDGWNFSGGNFEENTRLADSSSGAPFDPNLLEGSWLYAWERGAPPLLPWGDLPLFKKYVSYPVNIHYGIVLPAGTASIVRVVVEGEHQCYLDGIPVVWSNDMVEITAQPFPRRLDISVIAKGADDGLKQPIKVTVKPVLTSLKDWRLHGLEWFSGRCLYQNHIHINKQDCRYSLDLGQVCFYCEIWVNGKKADVRIWEPYLTDITDFLQDGNNEIAIVVANSAAVERRHMLVDEGQSLGWARYWNRDNIDREGENLVSGLLGPIRLFRQAPVANAK